MEKNQVFEMFLHHLKQVLVHRPEKPIDFLIDKFSNPTVKRFLIIGPAGSSRREHCKKLAATYGMNVVDTGSLLKLEVQKKTDLGTKI